MWPQSEFKTAHEMSKIARLECFTRPQKLFMDPLIWETESRKLELPEIIKEGSEYLLD
jgi:hypothetical protein